MEKYLYSISSFRLSSRTCLMINRIELKMNKRIVLQRVLVFICLIICMNSIVAQIHIVSSVNNAIWLKSEIYYTDYQSVIGDVIELFPDKPEQVIDGFGGCFNELGWDALKIVTAEKQNEIINNLFNSETGCAFNYCRMPLGANDYSIDWYSYNETINDFGMKRFSIERDQKRLIPYIQLARKIQPQLRLWASPWCPPSWMKINMHYACYPSKYNGLDNSLKGAEMNTQFRMKSKFLKAYALYFSKFIRYYKNEGIPIEAIHVQNEPNSCQIFPSCIWKPEDLAIFIGNYLGPKFSDENLETEIWLGTIERPHFERVNTVLENRYAKKYIKGVGFQWAGKDVIAEVHENYPNLKLMQSETECGNGSNDWTAAEHTFTLIDHYFKCGANSYMYWNMILKKDGISYWGWKQNAMISVDSLGCITYNPEFYVMKHFSCFVKQGACKIETSSVAPDILAFKNPDDSIIIVEANFSDIPKELCFKVRSKHVKFVSQPHSFNTIKII